MNKILIFDFGSQYTQLLAKIYRREGYYCEVVSFFTKAKDIDSTVKG